MRVYGWRDEQHPQTAAWNRHWLGEDTEEAQVIYQ